MQNQLRTLFTRLSSKANRKGPRPHVRCRAKLSHETLEARKLLAAVIWESGDITSDSDVSTNGTLVFALNATDETGPDVTVNGVNFVPTFLVNAESQSQSLSPGTESLTTTIPDATSTAFRTADLGSIGQIIQGGWFGGSNGNTATTTLAGLTVGDDYEVQIFANDARGNRDVGYVTRLGDGNGNEIDLQLNNQPAGDPAGDYGIGTFTADATTQSIELAGFLDGNDNAGRLQINAIQLRKLESVVLLPGAVPLVKRILCVEF